MKRQVIRVGDDLRVVVEVFCSGSIKLSLEQRKPHHISDHSWEPVSFRMWPLSRDGYVIRRPTKKKAERYIEKCRKAALRIRKSQAVARSLVPADNREDQIEELVSDIIRSAKQRLNGNNDFQFTEQNDSTIRRTAHAAGAYVANALFQASQPQDNDPRQPGEDIQASPSDSIRMVLQALAPPFTSLPIEQIITGALSGPVPEQTTPAPQEEETTTPGSTPSDRTDELIFHEDQDEEKQDN